MRILILTRITNKDGNSIYNSYTNGIITNYPDSIVIDYFNLYFEQGKIGFETSILLTVDTHYIDTVFINFVSGDLTFDLDFLKLLSERCYMIMNFYDGELFFEPIDRYYAQCADLVLLPTSSHLLYSYQLLGIRALATFSLFDTQLYHPKQIECDIDISFVGDVTKLARKRFLNALENAGYRVEIFGKGSIHGAVSFDKMTDIFSRSKINLNFSNTIEERTFNFSTNTNYKIVPKIMRYATQIKGRPIEVALCGGFVLSQYALGLEELFNDQEIASFTTEDDLIAKVEFYLSHDAIRLKMAQNAYHKALKNYDATRIFQKIFSSVSPNEKDPKIALHDKSFDTNYANHHALYLFNFLFKRKFSYAWQELKILFQTPLCFDTLRNHMKQQFYYQVIQKFKIGR